jgi:hypothetical protein
VRLEHLRADLAIREDVRLVDRVAQLADVSAPRRSASALSACGVQRFWVSSSAFSSSRKCWASSAMSSPRSRSGGRLIVNTLSR